MIGSYSPTPWHCVGMYRKDVVFCIIFWICDYLRTGFTKGTILNFTFFFWIWVGLHKYMFHFDTPFFNYFYLHFVLTIHDVSVVFWRFLCLLLSQSVFVGFEGADAMSSTLTGLALTKNPLQIVEELVLSLFELWCIVSW